MNWMIIFCVIPTIVHTITITPNGNSPEKKMTRVMLDTLDRQDSMPSESIQENKKQSASGLKKYQGKIAINERYRRLIPYMTFYYANDLVTPQENYRTETPKTVEVEKAEIVEAGTIQSREPKAFTPLRQKNIPRYFGNRLTQYNIASANPSKLYYDTFAPDLYQNSQKPVPNYNPEYIEPNTFEYSDRTYERLLPKPFKPAKQYQLYTKPQTNSYRNEDTTNVQYYSSEKEETPTYKLIPYEQRPPVRVIQNKFVPVPQKQYQPPQYIHEQVYIKPRPTRPQYVYETVYNREEKIRKPPTTVSELYYEQQPRVAEVPKQITLENGFKPIVNPSYAPVEPSYTQVPQVYSQDLDSSSININNKEQIDHEDVTYRPEYVENTSYKPVAHTTSAPATISSILNSLQLNKPLPKHLTRNNVSASIRTLLHVLSTLKAMPQQSSVPDSIETKETATDHYQVPQIIKPEPKPVPIKIEPQQLEPEFQEEPYLAPINTPSQHLDDIPNGGSSSQRFPLVINSDDEGGTPGRPGIDYPTLAVIPETSFDCKTQRYKGFFADTETRCQVWHYCDLNGGQASFLCPNGTIFSQAGLTCDWWFNVKCASTTQLYVLNESLYKFILPHSPKFPEDYSGPLVDKYLSLKFKEMEEQFRKNKNKAAKEADSKEDTKEAESSTEDDGSTVENAAQEVHVDVQSVGNNGNVERLQDA
ncbi:uncharacterized protein LOC121725765 [Aricia agestis]|uniref:uncharacterized protein LOC121725765 n=1 Tax=Aricia agestis TaxID=91739 RepID=UPI001C208E50|nr:uncharacterized protein LOC121725765 [Aricia agestis]